MAQHSILLADRDHGANVLVAALATELDLRVEPMTTGTALLESATCARPALVLLALDIENPSAYEVLYQLRGRFGTALPIAALAARDCQPRDEIAAVLLGADEYFARPFQADAITVRLRRLLGRRFAVLASEPERPSMGSPRGLTRRERQVLALLVSGHPTAEIAQMLCITRKTASTHIEHILTKLGAHSQAQAIAFAVRDQLVV